MREAIRSFLSFVKGRIDLSPIFYFAETVAKSHPEKRELYARERAAMIFALQTMDAQQFSQTGRVVPDPAAQAAQLAYSGVGSVEELISRYAGVASDTLAQESRLRVDCIYASLLKIALVQRQMRGDILAKYRAVREFMEHSLGIVLDAERFLALNYFARPQRYQRFIRPLQPGMRFTKFRIDLLASAWDLFLIRLPEQILSMSTPGSGVVSRSCNLSYVCTAEHALRDIMSSRSIETVYELEPELGGTKVFTTHNLEVFEAALGEDTLRELRIEEGEWQINRMLDSMVRWPVSSDVLADVIVSLEAEAAAFCKPGT
jgi:hypothetical protein